MLDGVAKPRARAIERHVVGAGDPLRRRRESEITHEKPVPERLSNCAVSSGDEMPHDVSARLWPCVAGVDVGDLHAARVVDQYANVVALRDRRRKQQHRPEEAEHQKEDRRPSQHAENPPIAPCALAADCGVCENRRHADERTRDEQHDDRGRGPKGEIPLLEHCRPVLEEKCEN